MEMSSIIYGLKCAFVFLFAMIWLVTIGYSAYRKGFYDGQNATDIDAR